EVVTIVECLITHGRETTVGIDLDLRRPVDGQTLPGLHRGAVVRHRVVLSGDGYLGRAHRGVDLLRAQQQRIQLTLYNRTRNERCGGGQRLGDLGATTASCAENADADDSECGR